MAETKEVDDLQERFIAAVADWESASEPDRQSLLDRTAIEMTMENLKQAGIVQGEGSLDLELCGMLYGYAYAKGYRPNMSEENLRKLLVPSVT